jgi:hypothetical protein
MIWNKLGKVAIGMAVAAVCARGTYAKDGKWDLFLLFGQSNMSGIPQPEAADKVTNPRIKVMAYDNCTNLGRTYGQWYLASPPLSECNLGVGPGDYFAKTLIDTSDKLGLGIDTIGLISCSISGAPIDMFLKGVTSTRRGEFKVPPDNKLQNAYPWMVARIKEAQKKGVVRGILFHQGESNQDKQDWPGQVKAVVDSLRKDCELGDAPFLAGELRYLNQGAGATNTHNALIAKLPAMITNCSVVSAKGLPGMNDQWHFNLVANREFGHRYCASAVPYLKAAVTSIGGLTVKSGFIGMRLETLSGGTLIRAERPLQNATLISVMGERVFLGSGSEFRLPPEQVRPGLYLLQARSGSAIETQRIFLNR